MVVHSGNPGRLSLQLVPPSSNGQKITLVLRRWFLVKEMEDPSMEFLLDAVDRFPLSEQFADSHEHLGPVPIVLLANSGAGIAVPADSNAGSGCSQQVDGDGADTARAGVRCRPDSSRARWVQSTDRVNPQAPGWTKRHSTARRFT
uniref:Uncharacterized protein n=1 Tax=Aegilops tauschii subsp. strangulata TaxID=200361 RepID=A0A453TCB4_AEGTS